MNNIKIKKLYISLTTFCLVLVLSFIVGKKYFYNTSKQFFKIYKESLIGFNYSQSKESILNSNTDWTKQNSTSQTNYWKHKSKFDSDFYKERFINFNNDGFRPSAFLNVKYNNPNYKLGIVAGVLGEGFRFSDSETVPALIKQFAEKNGWWYKKFQTMDPDEIITNGLINKDASLDDIGTILVKLNYSKFVKYPYIDTLCWLDKKEKTLSNKNGDILLKNTDGSYDEY